MSEAVKNMFSGIADSYDKTNDVFSFGMHRSWKSKAINMATIKNGENILDIATGTGDLAIEIKQIYPECKVFGLDFSPKMLEIARKKNSEIDFIEGDALSLPFDNSSLDKCFISYGIRNVDSVERCISEIFRVLNPNGKMVILETGKPNGIIYPFYRLYTKYILPILGKFLSKDKDSYIYLSQTANDFPCGKEFEKIIKKSSNFSKVYLKRLFFGSSYIYIGIK